MSTVEQNKTSFVTKAIIVAISVAAVISFLLPDTDKLKRLDTPINKLFALSFVQNPEALYMASEYWEKENKYENAVREMRLAIGLLEMHHADPAVLKRYKDRFEALKKDH